MTPFRASPPVERGLERMLAGRRSAVRGGDRVIGWKLGFGAPAAMEKFGTDRPLVGFLVESRVVADGASVSVGSWTAPALEPEVAVHLSGDVAPTDGPDQVRAAIGGLSVAIELADVDPPPDDVEEVLAGNIFHRHVMLGPVRSGMADVRGSGARVRRDGDEIAATDDVHALPGEPLELLSLTAELLASAGERLRAGDIVITGSVVPPIKIAPNENFEIDLDALGSLSLSLRG